MHGSKEETSELVGTLAVDVGWNESEVEEITSHLQDGRLVELSKSFLTQIKHGSYPADKGGGFGKIYISRVPIPGFKHKLVLKEIGGNDENSKSQTQLLGSVKNEKLASRVRHFAIVPLLAYHDDLSIGKYYLISPYFENGDLFDALRSDNGDKVLLDWKTRLKVIYQISCAIDYLHTNNSFRGTILHLDIKSKNIVLDKQFNARLIDFGLSRESMTGSNITTAHFAATELYRPPDVHKTSPLLDYYAFGVVIREMLTGLGPEGTCPQTPLRQLDMYNFAYLIQGHIWTLDVGKDLSSIASQCISSVDDDETSGQISSASIRTSLKSILIKQSVQKWTVLNDDNCEICMVNGQLENENVSFRRVSEINHSNCETKIKICCACMRNSYINPVKCQECDNEIKSIIGDGWGAILIAGFDEDNNSFQNDVKMFADAVSSKVLPSMCVSNPPITIDSATQTTEPVSARIDAAFKTINRHNLHTLVFLYSGHHGKQGLKVGTNEYVSMQHINSNIQECSNIKKVIAFMDCCQPERIRVKEEQRLIQFNATASTDTAISKLNEGSPFTKLLVQAFTMKASGGKCASPGCECRIDGPFITIDSLSDYIEFHRQKGFLLDMEPEKSLIKINWQNECLAYNYAYKVEFRFDIELPKPFTSKHTYEVLSTTVNDYDALIQKILFPRFADLLGKQLNVQQKPISHSNKNADCLCIVYDTGPKCCEEVDNIEKLLLAWNSKRLLCCKLRVFLPSNFHKPSGFFLKNGKPVKDCMHEKKEFELTEMESFINGLQDPKNTGDTATEKALQVFKSNMFAFIHGCKRSKRKHQKIQIRFIDLFEECTSCVVHLLLVDPGEIRESFGDLRNDCTVSIDNTLKSTDVSPSAVNRLKSTDISPVPLLVQDSNTTQNTLKLQHLNTMDFAVAGMDFMPDERLVVVYKNKKCVIMNNTLVKVGKTYFLRAIPLCVVCMSDHKIAVLLDNQNVCILSVNKDCAIREKRKFQTHYRYHSLRKLDNNTLIGFTRDAPAHARKITTDGRETDFKTLEKRDYTSLCPKYQCKCEYIPTLHTFLICHEVNNKLYLNDTKTGAYKSVPLENKIYALCQGPADSAVVVCDGEVVQLTMKGEILRKCSYIRRTEMVCVNKLFSELASANSSSIYLSSSTTTRTWRLKPRAQLEFAVSGMDFLPDGRIVAVYKNNTCVIMNDKLKKIGKKFLFEACPNDVVCMSDSEIAVALGNKTICILSVPHNNIIQEKRSLKTQVSYYKLSMLDSATMVGFAEERAGKITMDGMEQNFKSFVKTGYPSLTALYLHKCIYIPCIHKLATFENYSNILYLQDPEKGTSICVQFEKEIYALCQGPEGTVYLVCDGEFVHMSCMGRKLNKGSYTGYANRVCANKDFSLIALSKLSKVNLYKLSID